MVDFPAFGPSIYKLGVFKFLRASNQELSQDDDTKLKTPIPSLRSCTCTSLIMQSFARISAPHEGHATPQEAGLGFPKEFTLWPVIINLDLSRLRNKSCITGKWQL